MAELRVGMTKIGFKPPAHISPTEVNKELFVCREILEIGTELSIKLKDEKSFERYVQQLKPFYLDYKNPPESPRKYPILGLYLLYLLAEKPIGEFHTELELIPDLDNPYIRYVVELEQDIMEGRYNRIWSAKETVPVTTYEFFIDKLVETLRQDMADSMEASYHSLSVSDAKRLLMFGNDQEESFLNLVSERGWKGSGDLIVLDKIGDAQAEKISALNLIQQTLAYAHELERII
eukprot:TRINITY_DN13962_c0_g1_i1.p1 TRINITY_DN13962_c0_g1~~TRINITY_DN13962_c0_g1_i1.p1  ORF type:complete len:264 (-),score=53.15 TRINITY_DN13962_c0_g1_i1:103-804(-)